MRSAERPLSIRSAFTAAEQAIKCDWRLCQSAEVKPVTCPIERGRQFVPASHTTTGARKMRMHEVGLKSPSRAAEPWHGQQIHFSADSQRIDRKSLGRISEQFDFDWRRNDVRCVADRRAESVAARTSLPGNTRGRDHMHHAKRSAASRARDGFRDRHGNRDETKITDESAFAIKIRFIVASLYIFIWR